MRIISGKLRGRVIHPPRGLPVRPTTDQAKEGLFNVLAHRISLDGLRVLDLFAGTGNISFEFYSRGASLVWSVDRHAKGTRFIRETFADWRAEGCKVFKSDVARFARQLTERFDLIFMDPPYAMAGLEALVALYRQDSFLAADGLLILEHASDLDFSGLPGFEEVRKYGGSSFSFFVPDAGSVEEGEDRDREGVESEGGEQAVAGEDGGGEIKATAGDEFEKAEENRNESGSFGKGVAGSGNVVEWKNEEGSAGAGGADGDGDGGDGGAGAGAGAGAGDGDGGADGFGAGERERETASPEDQIQADSIRGFQIDDFGGGYE